jgi:superfamily II DNA/RNA helicase
MIKILNKKGINKLFPIQYETYNLIYKEEDVVAKDRTGSGKTLAFSLPIIMRMREKLKFKGNHNPKFLIVLPTR